MTQITLCDINIRHRVSGAPGVLYLGTSEFTTGAGDNPASTIYMPLLINFPVIEAALFGPARTRGRSSISAGNIVINALDGSLDYLRDWIFEAVLIRDGDASKTIGEFETVLTGRCGLPFIRVEQIEVPIRDMLAGFQKPLSETVYLGTNSGTSGNEGLETDLKGQLKPVTLGKCLQVPLSPANAADQRYQFHDGAASEIIEAYGNGSPLPKTDDAANGLIRFTGNIDGLNLTADVRGKLADGAYISKAADLIAHIATSRAGVTAVNAADVAVLNTFCPQELGAFYTSSIQCADAADFIASSVGAWYLPNALGELRMGRLTPPAIGPAVVLQGWMFTGGDLQVLQSADPEGGQIAWRVTVRGRKNWRTADRGQLAGVLSDERMAELTSEWRNAVAEDAAVKVNYPDAVEISIDTALSAQTGMQAEAARLLAIYSQPQQWLRIYPGSDHVKGVECGMVVGLQYDRFGLENAPNFVVMRMVRGGAHVEMDLWRVVA
jgi:hypothetical protein